jgi:hypothetical protein
VFKQRNVLQLSYELPQCIHASTVYPVRSPNGSRIVIYGHDEGIRIIWCGGRSYREHTANLPAKVNGTSKDEPMVIDLSDDDEPAPQPKQDAVFEEEEDEVDPAEPYKNVLRYIDIELSTSATHIAVPHISSTPVDPTSESHAPILSTHLVVAVACADLTIRLISLPLRPPAKSPDGPSIWATQIMQIPSSGGHQDFITNISITDYAEGHDEEAGADRNKSRSRSGARGAARSSRPASGLEWSFLVASTSCTGSGLLLIHSIPTNDQNTFSQSPEALFPVQRQLLRSPLSACRLSFNPSPHPSERASNLLVTLPDSGCVKVYQVISQSTHARGRRGSGATMDSTTSSGGSVRSSSKPQGRFLVTLYSSFLPPDEGKHLGKRKRPLDASWVLGGRAILALFEDGDFGVWDLEAAGPPSAAQTQNLVKGQSSVSGIQGGAQARFTIRGSLASSVIFSLHSKAEPLDTRVLAPMTPHTRKTRSDRLFDGRESDTIPATGGTNSSPASISVTEIPQTSTSQSSKFADESILLGYGDSIFHLPSLQTFWRTEVSARGTFGTSSTSKPNPLPPLRLGGQHITSLSQFSMEPSTATAETPELLATTPHSLLFSLRPLNDDPAPTASSLTTRAPAMNDLLLQRGELGIDGLENMLDDMNGQGNTRTFGKSVAFNDANMDVDLRKSIGTPTPKLTGRLRGTPAAGTGGFRPGQSKVRLFS